MFFHLLTVTQLFRGRAPSTMTNVRFKLITCVLLETKESNRKKTWFSPPLDLHVRSLEANIKEEHVRSVAFSGFDHSPQQDICLYWN